MNEIQLASDAGAVVKAKVAEVKQFETFGRIYTCESEEDEAAGHEALGAVKSLLNAADLERKKIVEPIKKVTTEVDAMFRDQITRPLEVVKSRVEGHLRDYATAQLRKKREAEDAERKRLAKLQDEQDQLTREAEAAAAAGDTEVAADLVQQQEAKVEQVQQARTAVVEVSRPVVVATSNATGGYKTRLVATITDPARVPDLYWRPDLTMIQLAVDQGAREIPGVQISEEVSVSNRRK
jgi:phage gp36-like protein